MGWSCEALSLRLPQGHRGEGCCMLHTLAHRKAPEHVFEAFWERLLTELKPNVSHVLGRMTQRLARCWYSTPRALLVVAGWSNIVFHFLIVFVLDGH